MCFRPFQMSYCCRIQQCGLLAHFGGQVPAREQRQGCTRYCVRRPRLISYFILPPRSWVIASTTKRSSTSRRLPSSARPTRPAPFESRSLWCASRWAAADAETRNRTLRREPALTQFETAQIANLCPATAEEAKSVIPRYVFTERGTNSSSSGR